MSVGYKIPPSKAHSIMDDLDQEKISYTVWNVEDTLMDPNVDFEIEVDQSDWGVFLKVLHAHGIATHIRADVL